MSKTQVHPAVRQAAETLRWRMRVAARKASSITRRMRERFNHGPSKAAPANLAAQWEWIVRKLLRMGGATVGNKVSIYFDGDDAIEQVWEELRNAKRFIWFEVYLFEPDRVGKRTLEELLAARKRGVRVILLIDALGSSNLPDAALQPLRDAGAEVAVFNRIVPWRRPAAMFRRDHRKIYVIDGRVGFCGGMNISEDYAGNRYGNSRFHDSMVRVEGPCVRDLASVTATSWRLGRERGQKKLRLPRRREEAGDTFVQVQASQGTVGRRGIQRAIRLTVRNAVSHCYITTPYFIPPRKLVRTIIRAAKRGVDVRILTAGVCDVPSVRLAATHVYGELLKHGVRIYEMVDSTLHAKTITIDGVYSTVGSFNLDSWSDKRNLEVNLAMIDSTVAERMQEVFLNNISTACEVTMDTWKKRPWWLRWVHWAMYHVLRI